MKIWEILKEENIGKIYIGKYDVYTEKITIRSEDGYLVAITENDTYIEEFNMLDVILKFDFEEVIDWSKVPVDTKILVSIDGERAWTKRYFAKYEDGNIYVWTNGCTSWTDNEALNIASWKYAKLYKEGEE